MAVLVAVLLLGFYVYRATQSRQLSQQLAIESQAIGSGEGVRTLRDIMGLAPMRLDCTPGELLISMAYLRCDVGGSIQARIQPAGLATYEGAESSGYILNGVYRARYTQRLSALQREQLRLLVRKWPKFDPEMEASRMLLLSRKNAMLVCEDGRLYGIPAMRDLRGVEPKEELFQVLEVAPARDPDAREIVCFH
ncbi:hypothetical protein [Pseudoxanthomonas sp. Root65]|uniref:hypothetical protein n=1 Tax=Pseudoxanthomonas sp. Root65 TaxID=1736576 RepID=UPI0012E3EB54|nr:hypothetical protein [Pseudoxanthomonas sp. Root65]